MSKTLNYKGYQAFVEFDAVDEIFSGRILGINDVIGFHADNVSELKAVFEEAVDDYLEVCATVGKSPEKHYSGNLMLRIDPAVHARAVLAAEAAGISLNQWGERVLSDVTLPPSEAAQTSHLTNIERRILVRAQRLPQKGRSHGRRFRHKAKLAV